MIAEKAEEEGGEEEEDVPILQCTICYLLHHIRKLLFSRPTLTISMFKLCFSFFQLISYSMRSALCLNKLFPGLVTMLLLLLEGQLRFLDIILVFLDGLLGFRIGTISMFQSNVKFIQISFQFFLMSDCLT